MRKLIFIGLAFGLLSCAVRETKLNAADLSCHDNWSTGASGSSVIWIPSQDQLKELNPLIPQGRKLACWNKMPNGKIFLINIDSGSKQYVNNYYPTKDGYSTGVEEIIIVAD